MSADRLMQESEYQCEYLCNLARFGAPDWKFQQELCELLLLFESLAWAVAESEA